MESLRRVAAVVLIGVLVLVVAVWVAAVVITFVRPGATVPPAVHTVMLAALPFVGSALGWALGRNGNGNGNGKNGGPPPASNP